MVRSQPGSAFEVGDAAFASGAPFDQFAEGPPVFGVAAGRSGWSLAGDGDGSDAEVVQRGVGAGFAVAAVGGHCAGWLAGSAGDAGDGRGELWCVGRVAAFDA